MNLKKQLNCRMVYLFPLYLDILGTISSVLKLAVQFCQLKI